MFATSHLSPTLQAESYLAVLCLRLVTVLRLLVAWAMRGRFADAQA